jgi:O-acetyl-ADP-ribose deacetylase (regulator of RNase III)
MSDRGPTRKRATPAMFKIAYENLAATHLDFRKRYTTAEWDLIRLGFVGEGMDRWTIFEKDGWLYFVRRWTGKVWCKVAFAQTAEGMEARGAMLNVRRARVTGEWCAWEACHLEWLIEYWLLGREPGDLPAAPESRVSNSIELVRDPLPCIAGIDAVAFGAKDTGAMGGGAAGAILAGAGEKVISAAREKLAKTSRRVGDAVVTGAYDLERFGISHVCHIVSIITNTAQGDWCPYPDRLYDGVRSGLDQLAMEGASTVGMAALATGEGRVKPAEAARFMLTAIRDHQRDFPSRGRVAGRSPLYVVLSLPTDGDYQAFEDYLPRL